MKTLRYEAWPQLPYTEFKTTAHLLHMASQVIGKLKLHTPFEPHWANVCLWLTSRGLTSGPIPYQSGMFSVEIDLIDHQIIGTTSWGLIERFPLSTMSVAQCTQRIFSLLKKLQLELSINMMPQEIANPIEFDKNTTEQYYDKPLANAWWRILLSSYAVMQRYHSHFDGETPPIGFMWGTFDLRDARYNGEKVPTTGINASYIRRNAMNEAQVETGWWHGNEAYQQAAYYSFTYPKPDKIELATIAPKAARWDEKLSSFILDYEAIRKSPTPEKDLLSFFESTYKAGAVCAKWSSRFVTEGEPV